MTVLVRLANAPSVRKKSDVTRASVLLLSWFASHPHAKHHHQNRQILGVMGHDHHCQSLHSLHWLLVSLPIRKKLPLTRRRHCCLLFPRIKPRNPLPHPWGSGIYGCSPFKHRRPSIPLEMQRLRRSPQVVTVDHHEKSHVFEKSKCYCALIRCQIQVKNIHIINGWLDILRHCVWIRISYSVKVLTQCFPTSTQFIAENCQNSYCVKIAND